MKITRLVRLSQNNETDSPNVFQVSTSSCKTIYDVGGVKVELYIIVGGIPALSLDGNYGYTVRFPKVEKWDSYKHWDKESEHYDFQNSNNIQGPTYEVLPEGIVTLQKYVKTMTARKDMAKSRYENLPIQETIISKRVLDKEYRNYVQAKLDIHRVRFSPVVLTYGSRDQIHLLPSWWKKAHEIFTGAFNKHRSEGITWDVLSEEEYQSMVRMLDIYLDYFQ